MLTGAGDQAFCAGGDLKEMAATELRVPPPDFVPQFGRTIEVEKPTIAAVNGVAYAGGFLLAQMCDLCVAADHARFAITEAKVGRGAPWAARLCRGSCRPGSRCSSCSPVIPSTPVARTSWAS